MLHNHYHHRHHAFIKMRLPLSRGTTFVRVKKRSHYESLPEKGFLESLNLYTMARFALFVPDLPFVSTLHGLLDLQKSRLKWVFP